MMADAISSKIEVQAGKKSKKKQASSEVVLSMQEIEE